MNMPHTVAFSSLGVTLRGNLYLPDNADQTVPIVVMAHGFSATISGMVADRYAESFQAAGLAVLLYDHRGLGISDGEPRQHINTWVQARGYMDAIGFVTSLPEIDQSRIAICGGHFGLLYYPSDVFDQSSRQQVDFLVHHFF